VGAQVESVLEAAERAAGRIREDAQDWARDYRKKAQQEADELTSQRVRELAQLTDNLIDRAQAVANQSDHLISTLDETGRRLLEGGGPSPQALLLKNPGAGVEEKPKNLETASGEQPEPEKKPEAESESEGEKELKRDEKVGTTAHKPESAKDEPKRAGVPQWDPGPVGKPADEEEERTPSTLGKPPVGSIKLPQTPPSNSTEQVSAARNESQTPGPNDPEQVSAARNEPQVSEGARLLATQMAVAGSTRDGVAKRLREEFGILDPTPILNEIGL
jgi:hypothetical protein